MCVHACESVCVRESVCVCVCVCVLDREWNWAFPHIGLVLVSMTVWLTGHCDYLTVFQEPLSAPYRCHIKNIKNVLA